MCSALQNFKFVLFVCFLIYYNFYIVHNIQSPFWDLKKFVVLFLWLLFFSSLSWVFALWWQTKWLLIIRDCSTPPSFPWREAVTVCCGCWFSAWEEWGFFGPLPHLSLAEGACVIEKCLTFWPWSRTGNFAAKSRS